MSEEVTKGPGRGHYVRTEEHKRRISEALKGRPKGPAVREHIRDAKIGVALEKDHIARIQLSMRRREAQKTEHLFFKEDDIRPKFLQEFIGNETVKKEILYMVEASKKTLTPLKHVLISGTSGCGKTTLARIIGQEVNAKVIEIHARLIKTQSDLRNLLIQLSKKGLDEYGNRVGETDHNIIILDELHEIKNPELLFAPMEEFKFPIKTYDDYSGEEIIKRFVVPQFCLIGCTNRWGEMNPALIERFQVKFQLAPYTEEDIVMILKNFCAQNSIKTEEDALVKIAINSKSIPRIAVSLMHRINTLKIAKGLEVITLDFVEASFDLFGIHEEGLTDQDIEVLKYLYRVRPRKVGMDRLAAMIGESPKSFKNYIGPFLEKEDFISVAPNGRFLGYTGAMYLRKHQLVKTEEQGTTLLDR